MHILMHFAAAVFFLALALICVGRCVDERTQYGRYADADAVFLTFDEGPGFMIFVLGLVVALVDLILWLVFGLLSWCGSLL